jgi:hypothetical protein
MNFCFGPGSPRLILYELPDGGNRNGVIGTKRNALKMEPDNFAAHEINQR